jgi:hypothetical protein
MAPKNFIRFWTISVLVALLVGACSGGPIAEWPWQNRSGAGDDVQAMARPRAEGRDISVRVVDENESEAARIIAFANEILSHQGFRPSATAPAVLVLQFNRPKSLSTRSGPGVGVYGRGGSSGSANVGIAIEIPVGRGRSAPATGRHELSARLETAAGKTVWKDYAVADAAVTTEIDAAVARRLIGRIVEKLARESATQDGLLR